MPVPILSPSTTVITGVDSLAQNFFQNSTAFLCQVTLGAGGYAVGSRILGLSKFTPQTALVTTAAVLGALAVCPSGADPSKILGVPPGFSGGQCPTEYEVSVRAKWIGARTGSLYASVASRGTKGRGPFLGCSQFSTGSRSAVARLLFANGPIDFGGQNFPATEDLVLTDIVYESVRRVDGQPDNCGDAPRTGGQVIYNTTNGDTIDNSKVQNNNLVVGIAPVFFNMGGVSGTFKLPFSDVQIGSLLPLTFSINIGGTRYGFERNPDGTGKPVPTNPDPSQPETQEGILYDIYKRLKDIEDCVCSSSSPGTEVLLPFVLQGEDCGIRVESLIAPAGSSPFDIQANFTESATLAQAQCENSSPEQLDPIFLFAATTLEDGRELFTGEISTEVVSLLFKITQFQSGLVNRITTYPAANQHKFGSIAYTSLDLSGGGDYVYVFDTETYYPLPLRGKPGKLRILMKAGISFEVYDSGERVKR